MILNKIKRRKFRVRGKVMSKNKSLRPRIVVFRSNKNIQAQLISTDGMTISSVSTLNLKKEISGKNYSGIEKARIVGKKFAEACVKLDIKEVVFDKGSYSYNGRISALADSCRESGLIF